MGSGESNPILNFVIGLVVGVGMTFLYIRFGIEMPAAMGVGQRITTEVIVKTAEFELFNSSNPALVRHRALAVILANEPEKFLAVDQAIGNRFLNEFLRQHNSAFQLNGPIVVNPPTNVLSTISRAKVGTKVLDAGRAIGTPTIGVKKQSTSIAGALLRQKFPDATNDVIDFLVAHPEIRANPIRIGIAPIRTREIDVTR